MDKIKIRKPCSPSTVKEFKEIKATEILVSWGGGMGGASKSYYATEVNGDELTLLPHGEKITINPKFIVHSKSVTFVKLVTDVTAHRNYSERTCKSSISTHYNLIPFGREYYIDEVGSAGTNDTTIAYLSHHETIK